MYSLVGRIQKGGGSKGCFWLAIIRCRVSCFYVVDVFVCVAVLYDVLLYAVVFPFAIAPRSRCMCVCICI